MILLAAVLPVGIIIMVTSAGGLVSENLRRKETFSEHNAKHVKRLVIKETLDDISDLKEHYINKRSNDTRDDSLRTKYRPKNIHTFKHRDDDPSSEKADDEPNSGENYDSQSAEQHEDYQNSEQDEDELDFEHNYEASNSKQHDDDRDSKHHDNNSKSKHRGDDTKIKKNNDDVSNSKQHKNDTQSKKNYDDDLNSKQQNDDDSNSKKHDNDDTNSKKYDDQPNSKKHKDNDEHNSKQHDDDDLDSKKYDDVPNSRQHDDDDDDPNSKQHDDDPNFELDVYKPNPEENDDDPNADDSHDHHTVYELTKKEIKHPHYRIRWDGRCGLNHSLHNGLHGQCDSHGESPCCSPDGWCGNTDEHCANGGVDYRGNCGPHLGLWLCADGTCIFIENVCNGKEDCIDGSDEPSTCPVHCSVDEFSCGSESEERKCISRIKLCDGVSDCDYGEDELDCSHNDL